MSRYVERQLVLAATTNAAWPEASVVKINSICEKAFPWPLSCAEHDIRGTQVGLSGNKRKSQCRVCRSAMWRTVGTCTCGAREDVIVYSQFYSSDECNVINLTHRKTHLLCFMSEYTQIYVWLISTLYLSINNWPGNENIPIFQSKFTIRRQVQISSVSENQKNIWVSLY